MNKKNYINLSSENEKSKENYLIKNIPINGETVLIGEAKKPI